MHKRHYSAKEAINVVLFSHSAMNLYILTLIIPYLQQRACQSTNTQILLDSRRPMRKRRKYNTFIGQGLSQ